jgi:hypothetical protein
MHMGPEDMKKYPDCTKLLQHLKITPKILNAFLEACKADALNGASQRGSSMSRERRFCGAGLRWSMCMRAI